jgi:multiple sugar transport system substrate-binding protein
MKRLYGALAASILASLSATSAFGEGNVTWLDDGSADLMLGVEGGTEVGDGDVIHLTKKQLGALFGPGKQPFAGANITILVLNGVLQIPIDKLRPAWEELSGGKLEIALVPYADLFTKTMLDVRQGTGLYDAMVIGSTFYGDLIAGDYILPIDEYMESGDYPYWTYDSMPAPLREIYTWDGVGYGVLNDADSQILYYRGDTLNDPEWLAKFKADRGYDMTVPPETWQQVLDISLFFNGKNWDDNDTEPDSGIVLHLKVGDAQTFTFESFSAPFAITPGDKVTRYHNVYFFDPTNMDALIASPGHVRALEFQQELLKAGPAAEVSWGITQAWNYFRQGKAIFTPSFGDLGVLCQDEANSNIKGSCWATAIPASEVHWDHEKQVFVETDNPVRIGNVVGESWHPVISAFSENPEATYSFLALMATKPMSLWNASNDTGIDPGYSYQFLEPQGEGKIEDFLAVGWNEADVRAYLGAYYDNFQATTFMPFLRLNGTPEYRETLDKGLSAAFSGQKTAQEALEDVAKEWDAITDRIGRDEQLKAYQEAIGYEG